MDQSVCYIVSILVSMLVVLAVYLVLSKLVKHVLGCAERVIQDPLNRATFVEDPDPIAQAKEEARRLSSTIAGWAVVLGFLCLSAIAIGFALVLKLDSNSSSVSFSIDHIRVSLADLASTSFFERLAFVCEQIANGIALDFFESHGCVFSNITYDHEDPLTSSLVFTARAVGQLFVSAVVVLSFEVRSGLLKIIEKVREATA